LPVQRQFRALGPPGHRGRAGIFGFTAGAPQLTVGGIDPDTRENEMLAMLQSFDDISDPSLAAPRVAALRAEMASQGLTGFIVPRADEHQGEYVPPCAERLRWITGFSGSAGTAAILADKSVLFVDGRYTAQAAAQVDQQTFGIERVPDRKLSAWLAENAMAGDTIGYDPKLHTIAEIEALERAAADKAITLIPTVRNPIDAVWKDRPAPPEGAVSLHPLRYAGVASAAKIADTRETLAQSGDQALVLTAPDSIAWLLNIRGSDVPHTPFALSFAIVPASGPVAWYIDSAKVDAGVRAGVAACAVLCEPAELGAGLTALGTAKSKVRLDPDGTPRWFLDRLLAAGASINRAADPCQLAKAKKNPFELEGARAAHRRDAVPMCRFLAWLDREAPAGKLDEITAARHLEALRQETGALKDLSFGSISAAGANAALPHYHPNVTSNAPILPNSVYLIDSGGQYLDGTTDVTRTVAIGDVGAEARRHFTLVLKGMIAISLARFPKGTRGADLDAFARSALWAAGCDYDHGTGHGVGSYLSVHEGPQGISKRASAVLEPGMIISNEPGYYREGAYGIRIETLVVVTPASPVPGGDRPMHGFETLTLVPIDRRMIVPALLSETERTWLDGYHARVLAEIGPLLTGPDRTWVEVACAAM
jgi:Xaa-Pro aminopeptidase